MKALLSAMILVTTLGEAKANCHMVTGKLTALELKEEPTTKELSGPAAEVGLNYNSLDLMPVRAVLWVEAIKGKGKKQLSISGDQTAKICADRLYVGINFYSAITTKPFDAYRIEVSSDGVVIDDYISQMGVINYGVNHNSNELDL